MFILAPKSSTSWIAVPHRKRDEALAALGLELTGETGNWFDNDRWSLLELDSGWTLLLQGNEWPDEKFAALGFLLYTLIQAGVIDANTAAKLLKILDH